MHVSYMGQLWLCSICLLIQGPTAPVGDLPIFEAEGKSNRAGGTHDALNASAWAWRMSYLPTFRWPKRYMAKPKVNEAGDSSLPIENTG